MSCVVIYGENRYSEEKFIELASSGNLGNIFTLWDKTRVEYDPNDPSDLSVDELKTEIFDHMQDVLTSNSKELARLIGTPNGFGQLKDLASSYEAFFNEAGVISPLSDEYHDSKLDNAWAGSKGIGVFALATTLHSQLQNQAMRFVFNDPVNGSINAPFRLFGQFAGEDNFGHVLGRTQTESGQNISQVLSYFLSASVDNEKEQILGKLNINEHTFGTYATMTLLGYDESQSVKFHNLPVIRRVIARANEYSSPLEGGSSFEALTKALEDVTEEIRKQTTNFSENEERGSLKESHADSLFRQFKQDKRGELSDKERQFMNRNSLKALYRFGRLMQYAEKIRSLTSTINSDSKFLPKNLGEQVVKEFRKDELINQEHTSGLSLVGVRDYINTSIPGFATQTATSLTGLIEQTQLLSSSDYNALFDQIVLIRDGDTSVISKSLPRDYRVSIQGYINAKFAESLSKETAEELRSRLIDGKVGDTKVPTLMESIILLRTHGRKSDRNNYLLNSLTQDTSKAKRIKYQANTGSKLDQGQFKNSWATLLESNQIIPEVGKSPADIAMDLIYYTLLTGGQQSAVNLMKFLPSEIYNTKQFKDTVDYVKNTSIKEGFNGALFGQFMQHNPNYAYNLNGKPVPVEVEGVKGTYFSLKPVDGPNLELKLVPYVQYTTRKGGKNLFVMDDKTGYYVKVPIIDKTSMYTASSQFSESDVRTEPIKSVDPREYFEKSNNNFYGNPLGDTSGRDMFFGAIEDISSRLESEEDRALYKILSKQIAEKYKGPLVFMDDPSMAPDAGSWSASNTVSALRMNLEFADPKVMLHELIHGVTIHAIFNPDQYSPKVKEAIGRLSGMRELLNDRIRRGDYESQGYFKDELLLAEIVYPALVASKSEGIKRTVQSKIDKFNEETGKNVNLADLKKYYPLISSNRYDGMGDGTTGAQRANAEFIAGLGENEDFKTLLKSIESKNKKSFFENIVEAFRNLVKAIVGDASGTIYERALEDLVVIAGEKPQVEQSEETYSTEENEPPAPMEEPPILTENSYDPSDFIPSDVPSSPTLGVQAAPISSSVSPSEESGIPTELPNRPTLFSIGTGQTINLSPEDKIAKEKGLKYAEALQSRVNSLQELVAKEEPKLSSLRSIPVKNRTDVQKAEIKALSKSIARTRKQIEDFEARQSVVATKVSMAQLLEFAKLDLKAAKAVLKHAKLGSTDMEYAVSRIRVVKDMLDFWTAEREDIRFFDYTSEVLEEGNASPGLSFEEQKNNYDAIRKEAVDLQEALFKIAKDVTQNALLPVFKGYEDQVKLSDLFSINEVGSFTSVFLDSSRTGNPLLMALDKIQKDAMTRSDDKFFSYIRDFESRVEEIKKHPEFKKKGWDLFLEKDKHGKYTGKIINAFSHEAFKQKHTLRRLALNSKREKNKAWKRYYNYVRDNEISLDPTKLFKLENGTWVLNTDTKYIDEMKKVYPASLIDEIQLSTENKIQEYLDALDVETMVAEENIAEGADRKSEMDRLRMWEVSNSPFEFYKHSSAGKPSSVVVNGQSVLLKGMKYMESFPKMEKNGKPTGFYNQDYLNLIKDPKLESFLGYYTKSMLEFDNLLPSHAKRSKTYLTLPMLERELFEDGIRNKSVSNIMQLMKQKVIDGVTISENDLVYGDIDTATGNPKKRIPVYFQNLYGYKDILNVINAELSTVRAAAPYAEQQQEIKELEELRSKYEEKNDSKQSYDMDRIFRAYAKMSLDYHFKSKVEDVIALTQQVVKKKATVELKNSQSNTKKHKVKNVVRDLFSKDSNDMTNFLKMLDHEVDKLYGDTFDRYWTSDKKSLNAEEKEMLKVIESREKKAKDDLDKETISKAEYDLKLQRYSALKNTLGRSLSFDESVRRMLEFNQLRGMGWNTMGAAANLGFGLISNFTFASGEEFYTEKDSLRAFNMAMSGVTNFFTTGYANTDRSDKIRALMERFNVLKDFDEEAHQVTGKKKGKGRGLNRARPYTIQGSTEYFIQSMHMISMMLGEKVTVTKNGKEVEIPLWEAFDKNGKWNSAKYGENTDWEGDSFDTNQGAKFVDFKLKIDQTNKQIHGNYDPDSLPRIKRTVWGKALMQYRSWLPEGIADRFEKEKFDLLTKKQRKGRYITPYTVMKENGWSGMFRALWLATTRQHQKLKDSGLTDKEIDLVNLKKLGTEVQFKLAILTVMAGIGAALKDDDDWKEVHNLSTNLLQRVSNDLSFYYNPFAFSDLIQQPVALLSLGTDAGRLVHALYEAAQGDFEYERGINAKRNKVWVNTKRVAPGLKDLERLFTSSQQVY